MVGPKPARVPGGSARQQVLRHSVAVCLLAASVASCGTATATLSDLTTLDELKNRFNQDAGTMRILLLLAPT